MTAAATIANVADMKSPSPRQNVSLGKPNRSLSREGAFCGDRIVELESSSYAMR